MLALHHTPKELRIWNLDWLAGKSPVKGQGLPRMNEIRNSNFALRNMLALHTDHLLNLGDDLHQIFLVLHHRFD